ncbi:helix-turn-helix domain-containing protein [Pelosinus sp. sgz500959]|uniref:helix-turn-helix domain-containing protein n=1 Tax=Pelosinus sp. sgz500959 TaxID=3242472 RepID=UPI00366CE32C
MINKDNVFKERIAELFENEKDRNPKMTQEEFAGICGASRSQFTGWLSGQGSPNPNMLRKIATAWNVSTDWLVGKTDIRQPIETIAAHRTDNIMDGLPPEAEERVLEFIELMKIKHGKKST